jgi:glycosyltransferase involved in cell wall biosynthesis
MLSTSGSAPLVSVVIPSYNHQDYVEEAVLSVWNQTYLRIEIIVVDDNSLDGTVDAVKRLCAASPMAMRIIEKSENRGICHSLNLGLEAATGEYICFLASDDRYLPDKIESHLNQLLRSSDPLVAGCCGSLALIHEDGMPTGAFKSIPMPAKNQHFAVLGCNLGASLQGATFLTKAAQEVGFDPSLYFEDWDFYIRFTIKYRLIMLSRPCCQYRINASGANRDIEKMVRARLMILDKYNNSVALDSRGRRRLKSAVCLGNSKSYFNASRYRSAWSWLLRSCGVDPFILASKTHRFYVPALVKRSLMSIWSIFGELPC